MFMPVLSGLVVSVDAFFIGLSLGLQKRCKFLHLAIINGFLLILCMVGFLIAGQIYSLIPFDPDIIVGISFISLGLWTILHFLISSHIKRRKGTVEEFNISFKTIAIVGLVMSLEAMLITMGITFIFIQDASLIIPLTVAMAHFGYSAISFYLARTKHVRRIPIALSQVISGSALVTYGLMAIFVEIGM